MGDKAKLFEQKIKESSPGYRAPEPGAPAPSRNADGAPSAGGLKATFEKLANPDPPKATTGKVAWSDDKDQGRKKVHQPGYDPTKPPPPRSLDSLP